jgi:hypothetical protein
MNLIRQRLAWPLIFAYILALSACGTTTTASVPKPDYVPRVQCPIVTPATDGTATDAPPATTALPAGFIPVSALRCNFSLVAFPNGEVAGNPQASEAAAQRGWLWTSVEKTTGPLDGLAQALRGRPQPRDTSHDLICATTAHGPIAIKLTDKTGHSVLPAIPTEVCGGPLKTVIDAMQALTWTTIQTNGPSPTPSG